MNIVRVEKHGVEELIKRLKNVSMLTDPEICIYKNTFISLENIHTDELSPPQSYVLTSELLKVRSLRWQLQKHGVDLFNLNGYASVYLEDYQEPIDVMPPVIEESVERDGSVHNIVCDGMHRVYLARLEWVIPQVIFIRGIPKEMPYYAYPVQGGWNAVVLREDLPEGFIKKWHRIPGYKTLYRNFNSAFDNVGGPRGRFNKK
ncbi:hypothetical protein DCCM_4774 [Desulfocucumis palustris]|uniref:ParB-like catalytic effector domain-containing protein n=1 Tax=Desulfocucumis palustris TaxID=1898651 RepID=A0A2L2XHF9_9FIRM|nr:hypothetical protein [Desulfocucumis palustris]GBF35645.1 hypothetical protein DCCM_4774 [Desulfocucumis palustris]